MKILIQMSFLSNLYSFSIVKNLNFSFLLDFSSLVILFVTPLKHFSWKELWPWYSRKWSLSKCEYWPRFSNSFTFSMVIKRLDVWLESFCSQLLMSFRQGCQGTISSVYLKKEELTVMNTHRCIPHRIIKGVDPGWNGTSSPYRLHHFISHMLTVHIIHKPSAFLTSSLIFLPI